MDTIERQASMAPVVRASKQIAGADAPSSGSEGMIFNGGKVAECAYIYPVFLGTKWQDNETYAALAGQLQLFITNVLKSNYIGIVKQYGFLAGAFVSAHFEGAGSTTPYNDASIAQLVADLVTQEIIPNDGNQTGTSIVVHAPMIFMDDTVTFQDSWLGSIPGGLYGYHYYNTSQLGTPIYYGLISPMTDSYVAGDPGMLAVPQLDRITRVTSHELGEMFSDPQFPNGWHSTTANEIGDICEGQYGSFQISYPDGTTNTWGVQKLYSLYDDENGSGICVLSTAAGYQAPADAGRAVPFRVSAAAGDVLLPLPATYRQGGKVTRKQSETLRYARRLMAGLSHEHIHGQIPSLLREMADALERGTAMAGGGGAHRPVVRKQG